ncbi:2-keto-4-pentenoate hydratase [Novosphingobium sp. Gsoil 351]|uniref:2-keto-4-pentenoate hydratase n=1 Tax=Novosphingobium sp. Gsoil 351 TaxID=2675225 RepID=UPI0012B4B18E|nr:2-oxopent-4-enoate hydratase [Novosphingobium sp. Gsoil 351]QGN54054.1 2-oxopent-4-enoate hydratase [Novosphingobium sp. Gsoil 351]
MPDEPDLIAAHAQRLFTARITCTTTDLVTSIWPTVTTRESQRIAEATLALSGERQVGFKLGYTSQAMRRQMNIDVPNFGRLEQRMDCSNEVTVPLIHPRIEPEVALRIGRDIDFVPRSDEEALMVIDAAIPSLEIVDTRYHDYVFTFEDNVADNSSAAGFVLGAPCSPRMIAGDGCGVLLTTPSGEHLAGHSSAAMGGTLAAFRWLCTELQRIGETIAAGSIILTGGLTAAPYLKRGMPISAAFVGMGCVELCW